MAFKRTNIEAYKFHWQGLMYIDDSIIFGAVIIIMTCAFMGYWAHFAYKHIKEDIAKNES